MNVLSSLRHMVGDRLWLRALMRHKTRMGRVDGPRYTAYLRHCQKAWRGQPSSAQATERAAAFERDGFVAFHPAAGAAISQSILDLVRRREAAGDAIWDADDRYRDDLAAAFPELENLFAGETGDFLRAAYGAEFKIYYGVLYRSVRRTDEPVGSQLWHADGGPGTCINLMFYLSAAEAAKGAMECLPWPNTLAIFRRERRALRQSMRLGDAEGKAGREALRDIKSSWYRAEIERSHQADVAQPTGGPGMVLAFRNNLLHKGGFPDSGHERMVCVFHIYPADKPASFLRYRQQGIGKAASYPVDPSW